MGSTGPIVFAEETPRHQLEENGVVTTLRENKRTVGNTWWRSSRTGEKQGNCHVELLVEHRIEGKDIRDEWVAESGFDSLKEWANAYRRVSDGAESAYIYRVTAGHDISYEF